MTRKHPDPTIQAKLKLQNQRMSEHAKNIKFLKRTQGDPKYATERQAVIAKVWGFLKS